MSFTRIDANPLSNVFMGLSKSCILHDFGIIGVFLQQMIQQEQEQKKGNQHKCIQKDPNSQSITARTYRTKNKEC
jgi:hypothetical protein